MRKLLAQRLRDEIAHRQWRARFMPATLLGEPGWDILIDLGLCDLEGRKVSITDACIASGVPATTALRWIALLLDAGLSERAPDAFDRRRSWLRITSAGMAVLEGCFGTRAMSAAA